MCKNCVHENVCRYKTEFENLKNDIAKVTPTWAPDHYVITIECKNFRKEGAEGKPLKGLNSYQDRPEEWGERSHWIVDDSAVLSNIRYPALSYRVNASGKEIYHDIDRWVFEAPDCPNIPWHNGFLSNYLDEKFPIQFPYNPITIHVRVEEILTDPAHGDYDAQHIIDFVDPETGKTVRVDACFEEVDGKWQEIGKRKWYVLRKKHGERLAAILRAKEN